MAKNSLFKSFVYAFQGMGFAWKERNFRLHLVSTVLVTSLGFYFRLSNSEWTAVVLCVGGVIALEVMNTAIEGLVDKVSPDYDQKAGRIKDLSAAAVLVFSLAALAVGLIIFIPRLSALIAW